MKKTTLLFSMFALLNFFVCAQDKTAMADITDVTVFLSGAQITGTSKTNVNAGISYVTIQNLPYNINPSTIQVKGKGAFTILSVNHQINYLVEIKKTKDITRMEDSVKLLTQEIASLNSLAVVYREEEAMLLANKAIGGSENGVKVADLKEAVDYFRVRLTDIKKNQLQVQTKITQIQELLNKINLQLSQLTSQGKKPSSEVVIGVSAAAASPAEFVLSYIVTNAGWIPSYDLRAVDAKSPIQLMYKAQVYQTTGFDWKNIKLTLSTGNPMLAGNKPELATWYAYLTDVYTYRKSKGYKRSSALSESPKSAVGGVYDKEESNLVDAVTIADLTTYNESQTSASYEIGIPYNIPSDGKKYDVEIQKNTLAAEYVYYAVPKLDKTAFLVANVTGWEQYNLLPGDANLFFEGTYVGKSFIDPQETKDTLQISLGRDNNIVVERTKIKDLQSKSLIGNTKKVSYGFEISVRNKKKEAINIIIEDQVPITTNKDLEIEVVEISGAKYDKDNGKLEWNYTINPTESKKMKLKYNVKYPKDKILQM